MGFTAGANILSQNYLSFRACGIGLVDPNAETETHNLKFFATKYTDDK